VADLKNWIGYIVGAPGDEEELRSLGFVLVDVMKGPEPVGSRGWVVEGDDAALAKITLLDKKFLWDLHKKGLSTPAIDEYIATGERPWFGDEA